MVPTAPVPNLRLCFIWKTMFSPVTHPETSVCVVFSSLQWESDSYTTITFLFLMFTLEPHCWMHVHIHTGIITVNMQYLSKHIYNAFIQMFISAFVQYYLYWNTLCTKTSFGSHLFQRTKPCCAHFSPTISVFLILNNFWYIIISYQYAPLL